MTRNLLITGGGRGIGAATAIEAARRGYRVCINYRHNTEAAENVVDQITLAGGEALAVCADVSREAEVLELYNIFHEHFGYMHGLVNNAGILETQMRMENIHVMRLQRILDTNVVGSFLCAREAVKRMSTLFGGQGGAIVNVSSGAALTGSPNEYVDYAMSKGAIDSMTRGLAQEVAEHGIRVNAVRPGFIYTDMHADGGEPGRVDRVKEFVPMKRGGQSQEVANAILWLLSDESSYTTREFINVMGGR
jgi:NAD(P)-dependent dehydrogenase (short-subunit alcohol dehydrogenase family)